MLYFPEGNMLTGAVITLIGMITVFVLLSVMISMVKVISLVFHDNGKSFSKGGDRQDGGREQMQNNRSAREDREIAIAIAALKNVLG